MPQHRENEPFADEMFTFLKISIIHISDFEYPSAILSTYIFIFFGAKMKLFQQKICHGTSWGEIIL